MEPAEHKKDVACQQQRQACVTGVPTAFVSGLRAAVSIGMNRLQNSVEYEADAMAGWPEADWFAPLPGRHCVHSKDGAARYTQDEVNTKIKSTCWIISMRHLVREPRLCIPELSSQQ